MPATFEPSTLDGTVTNGAVIWNGSAWVNELVDASNLSTAVQARLLRSGIGSPQGSVAAPVGTLYTDTAGTAGTTLWVKESGASGNTGWVAK